jgi:hypothetical protein
MRNMNGQHFIDFLRTFRRGEVSDAADDDIAELLEAIKLTGGGGTFTLKLKIKPNKKTGALEIDPSIAISKPKPTLQTGIYFIGDDYRPSRQNPDQMDIDDIPGVSPTGRS